jgi:hypothetical protein
MQSLLVFFSLPIREKLSEPAVICHEKSKLIFLYASNNGWWGGKEA